MSEFVWHQIVLNQQVFSRIDSQCNKKISDSELADEAVSYVLEKLSQDDWARCKKFSGKSEPETFIYSMTNNLIIDFMRSREGRARPPKWLKDKGSIWVRLWEEICLARKHIETVVDKICVDKSCDPNIVRQTISIIKGKIPWCGVSSNPIDMNSDSDESDHFPDQRNSPEHAISNQHMEHGLRIASLLINGEFNPDDDSSLNTNNLKNVFKHIELSNQDRLILKMHFSDGLSFNAIAGKLGVALHQPARQIKKILEDIRKELESAGISFPQEV